MIDLDQEFRFHSTITNFSTGNIVTRFLSYSPLGEEQLQEWVESNLETPWHEWQSNDMLYEQKGLRMLVVFPTPDDCVLIKLTFGIENYQFIKNQDIERANYDF